MSQNYIGINGLVVQSLDEIVEDLKNKFRGIYGYDINLEQNSPDAQWINILAQEKKDTLDLFTQLFNNLDPDRVVGIAQQILYKLNGLVIKAYTYSFVYINVVVNGPATLQGLDDNLENPDGVGYTVTDSNGNRWILTTTQNFETPGVYLLNFRAAELGAITALPNTINIMETIVTGVSSVNNPANNYITGDTGETSSEFRNRRDKTMEAPSQGFDESLQSQLLNLDNVTQAKVYDNRSDVTVNNIPPHTVWTIVEGGNPADIGRTIYNNVPPGIPMKGQQVVEVPKINGLSENVYYDLLRPINLYIKATIQNFTQFPLDEVNIKQNLAKQTYEIRERAETSNITTILKNAVGDSGNPYNVEISQDNVSWAENLIPTGLDEYFVITPDNIALEVISNNG